MLWLCLIFSTTHLMALTFNSQFLLINFKFILIILEVLIIGLALGLALESVTLYHQQHFGSCLHWFLVDRNRNSTGPKRQNGALWDFTLRRIFVFSKLPSDVFLSGRMLSDFRADPGARLAQVGPYHSYPTGDSTHAGGGIPHSHYSLTAGIWLKM